MRRILLFFLSFLFVLAVSARAVSAVTPTPGVSSGPSPEAESSPAPDPTPRPDITQKTEETLTPLGKILSEQELGPVWPSNPVKYAIRGAVGAGVPANTIVLLLLIPAVASLIAAARHLVGLRGFGIFLPAALSVVFVAIGPVVGIGLFMVIIVISTLARLVLRKFKVKLQYLPRMALLLWLVALGVLGILFLAPVINYPDLSNVSIFPVLVLALLAEDFARVQLGKSVKTAISLTTETLILSLVSFSFLTFKPLQEFALLNPEILLLSVGLFDFLLGKYVGLRLLEFWRFRKLISS